MSKRSPGCTLISLHNDFPDVSLADHCLSFVTILLSSSESDALQELLYGCKDWSREPLKT